MEKELLKQIRGMKICLAVVTLALLLVTVYLLQINNHPRFDEIDVERLNVIEKDGTVKMVISNEARQSPGRMNGRELPARQRSAGIIFFNNDGDECGGLVYDGNKKSASMALSVDQYLQDQVMQLQYAQENGEKHYGLKLYDRPDINMGELVVKIDSLKKLGKQRYDQGLAELKRTGQLGTDRLFVGRMADGSVGLFIKDAQGIPKIKLYVDKDGKAKIEMADKSRL